MRWTDLEDIAIELYDADPDYDPLKIRFTDLLDKVLEIEGFEGKREECNEKKLEVIQMAWYEEWKENQ